MREGFLKWYLSNRNTCLHLKKTSYSLNGQLFTILPNLNRYSSRLEEKHLSSILPITDAPTIRGTLVLDSWIGIRSAPAPRAMSHSGFLAESRGDWAQFRILTVIREIAGHFRTFQCTAECNQVDWKIYILAGRAVRQKKGTWDAHQGLQNIDAENLGVLGWKLFWVPLEL